MMMNCLPACAATLGLEASSLHRSCLCMMGLPTSLFLVCMLVEAEACMDGRGPVHSSDAYPRHYRVLHAPAALSSQSCLNNLPGWQLPTSNTHQPDHVALRSRLETLQNLPHSSATLCRSITHTDGCCMSAAVTCAALLCTSL